MQPAVCHDPHTLALLKAGSAREMARDLAQTCAIFVQLDPIGVFDRRRPLQKIGGSRL